MNFTPALLHKSVSQRFLATKLASATGVTFNLKAAVANNTELLGSDRQFELHTRVRQAAEHDLANKLRALVNRGASTTRVVNALTAYLNKHEFITTYLPYNRRVYVEAKRAYATTLLERLQNNPVTFLRSIKAATLQKRVNYTFVHRASGGTK